MNGTRENPRPEAQKFRFFHLCYMLMTRHILSESLSHLQLRTK